MGQRGILNSFIISESLIVNLIIFLNFNISHVNVLYRLHRNLYYVQQPVSFNR